MTLLGVVDNLNHRIEGHQHLESTNEESESRPLNEADFSSGNEQVDEVSIDLAELENVDYTLRETLGGLKKDMDSMQTGWKANLVCPPLFPLLTWNCRH